MVLELGMMVLEACSVLEFMSVVGCGVVFELGDEIGVGAGDGGGEAGDGDDGLVSELGAVLELVGWHWSWDLV